MSKATASALEPAGASDVFLSTRQNYERFAFLLLRSGHLPDLSLSHLDFRLLLFLLGQKPGHYAAHHRTIAAACGSNTTSIRQSLGRLRDKGLVLWELIPPHHALPSGRFTRTNVNRYWVHLPRLAGLLDASRPPATFRDPNASTLPKSVASSRTVDLHEPKPLPPTPLVERRPRTAKVREEAISSIPLGEEIEPIRQAWEKLGLGKLDGRSERALQNRVADGATTEQLHAAVAGAGVDDWLRRRAKVPFAVVFASVASVERFAHEGRKILGRSASPPLGSPPRMGREEVESPPPKAPQAEGDASAMPFHRRLADAAAGSSGADATHRPPGSGPTGVGLAGLVKGLAAAMSPHRSAEDTPQARRRLEQAEFDRRRLELVAALQSLDK